MTEMNYNTPPSSPKRERDCVFSSEIRNKHSTAKKRRHLQEKEFRIWMKDGEDANILYYPEYDNNEPHVSRAECVVFYYDEEKSQIINRQFYKKYKNMDEIAEDGGFSVTPKSPPIEIVIGASHGEEENAVKLSTEKKSNKEMTITVEGTFGFDWKVLKNSEEDVRVKMIEY